MPRPSAITLGPGKLYIAVLGSTEPVDLAAAWAAAWVELGYTEDGSTFNYELSVENVEVAETFDPIKIVTTARSLSVEFALAEITKANLNAAFNGGTATTAAGVVTFEPPNLGNETRVMLGWQADDLEERWVYRQCLQTGNVGIGRKKAPGKATLPVRFSLEKPDTGLPPFKVLLDNTARG